MTGSLPALLDVGLEALKVLAVLGGVALGGVGGGWLLRGIVRFAFHRQTPVPLLRVVQLLGAVALGLAVWFWAYGPGGSGFGFGGGFGLGGSGSQGTDKKAESEKDKKAEETPTPPTETGTAATAEELMRIEVLGGARVQKERFYLIEGDKEPKSMAELRAAIDARQQAKDKPPLKGIVILANAESVPENHAAMISLRRLAKNKDLSVTVPPKGSGP